MILMWVKELPVGDIAMRNSGRLSWRKLGRALGSLLLGSRPVRDKRYILRLSPAELAATFHARVAGAIRIDEQILSAGSKAAIVRLVDGSKQIETASWGFVSPEADTPRTENGIILGPTIGPRHLDAEWLMDVARPKTGRCLIPVERFSLGGNPKPQSGHPWFSVLGQPCFAWAGICQPSANGHLFAGVMSAPNRLVSKYHGQMPLILHPADWDRWLEGELDDLFTLQRPYRGPMTIIWVQGDTPNLAARSPVPVHASAPEAVAAPAAAHARPVDETDIALVIEKIASLGSPSQIKPVAKKRREADRAVQALERLAARAAQRNGVRHDH
jgi:putative SOS response-associated peptidase YedK